MTTLPLVKQLAYEQYRNSLKDSQMWKEIYDSLCEPTADARVPAEEVLTKKVNLADMPRNRLIFWKGKPFAVRPEGWETMTSSEQETWKCNHSVKYRQRKNKRSRDYQRAIREQKHEN